MKTKIYTQAEVNKIKVDEYNKGIDESIIAMASIYTLLLFDKYDFGCDNAMDLAGQVDKQYSMIREGYSTLTDVKNTLRDEYGITFE